MDLINTEIPMCARCGNTNVGFVCGKCREWYCSHQCQSDDWYRHKRVCVEMPRLVPLTKAAASAVESVTMAIPRFLLDSENIDGVNRPPTLSDSSFDRSMPPMPNLRNRQSVASLDVTDTQTGQSKRASQNQESISPMQGKARPPADTSDNRPVHSDRLNKATQPSKPAVPAAQHFANVNDNRSAHSDPSQKAAESMAKPSSATNDNRSVYSDRSSKAAQPNKPAEPVAKPPIDSTDTQSVRGIRPTAGRLSALLAQRNSDVAPDQQSKKILRPDHPIIGSGSKVTIVHVVKYSSLYVVDVKLQKEYQQLLKDVATYAKRSSPITAVEVDMYVAAPLESGIYARAMVIRLVEESNGELMFVAFVDHGYPMQVELSQLRSLSDELILRDRLPRKIVLKNVPEALNSPEFLAYLQCLQDDQIELKLLYEGGFDQKTTECELFHMNGKQLLDYQIEKDSLPDGNGQAMKHAEGDILEAKGIQGMKKQVYITDKSLLQFGLVSGFLIEDLKEFTSNQEKVAAYCENLPNIPHLPKASEICFARFAEGTEEPQWYRGQCQEVTNGEAEILFVDYGNVANLTAKDIRPAPKEFHFKCITGTIELGDITVRDLPKKSLDFLQKRVNELFTFDEVTYDEATQLSIGRSAALVDEMKKQQLI